MIITEINRYFTTKWKKWIICSIILLLFNLIFKRNVAAGFLPANKSLILKDFIFASFSSPIYIIFTVPILYSYLTYDVFTKDYEGGYLNFILTRASSRANYFVSKSILILIISNLFFLMNFVIIFIVGIIYRLPFRGQSYYCVLKLTNNTISSGLLQYSIYILGIFALGMLILVISIIFNSGVYPVIITAALIFQAHAAIFNRGSLFFSLIAQLSLQSHYPFNLYKNQINGTTYKMQALTINYSLIFFEAVIIIAFLLGFIRITRMNLYKKI